MSAVLCHRLIANPVSASAVSCRSHRPRSPLLVPPFATTVALYVFSNSFHEPALSLPHVIRMIMTAPPSGCPRSNRPALSRASLTVAPEILHRALMLLGRRASLERSQSATLTRLRVFLP